MACRVLITTVRSLAEPGAWAESPAGAVGFRRVTHPPGPGNLSGPIGLGRGASSVGRGCTGLPAELLISQLPLPCSPVAEETGNQITSVWAASRVCLCPLVPVTRTSVSRAPPIPSVDLPGTPPSPPLPSPGNQGRCGHRPHLAMSAVPTAAGSAPTRFFSASAHRGGVSSESTPGRAPHGPPPSISPHSPPAGSELADPSDFPLKTNRLIVANLPQRLRWWPVSQSAVGEGRGHRGVSPYVPRTHAHAHQRWPGRAPRLCPRTSCRCPAAALTLSPPPAAVRLGPPSGQPLAFKGRPGRLM